MALSDPDLDSDQSDQGGHFEQWSYDARKGSPEFNPKAATETTVVSSKQLPAAVKDSGASITDGMRGTGHRSILHAATRRCNCHNHGCGDNDPYK